jgi:perosamine synthetase
MIPISKPDITQAEKDAVLEVLDSGMLAQGPRTAKFEESFARAIGVKHAIAVSSGTTGLHLALLSNNIGPGDEVITTPFTFIATASAILFTGARPVFVDIDAETFNIDPMQVEAAITPRTKAILPVHLYGQMCDMESLQPIAQKYGLLLIEDACQAVMATRGGRYAGSVGTGVFSFYATKNLFCGEGGMITTNDDEIDDKCRLLRNQGMKRRYHHEVLGYNFRMTDIQAAIGLVQLERQSDLIRKRMTNAAYFNSRIKAVITPKAQEGNGHVWHQYTVRVRPGLHRDTAVQCLSEAGIGTGIFYPVPIHQQPYIRDLLGEINLPVAEKMANEVFSLPVHSQLNLLDLEKIVDEVNKL